MIALLSSALIFIGLMIQVAALVPMRKLMALIPLGPLHTKWSAMSGLIFVFIAGYLGYGFLFWGEQTRWLELIVPLILLFGAMFVWLTVTLSLQTSTDLLRIHELEKENVTDSLTKVYNRRYLDHRLNEEVARSRRYENKLSILMLDIDHFKRVNDTYGHQAGDTVLRTLATLVKTSLRDLDVFARYGGEEFMVICPDSSAEGATLLAERLRLAVQSQPVDVVDDAGNQHSIQVLISVGVACLGGVIDSREKLVQAADKALYRAKEEGRNRVVVA